MCQSPKNWYVPDGRIIVPDIVQSGQLPTHQDVCAVQPYSFFSSPTDIEE
jgi:hypothetical protein